MAITLTTKTVPSVIVLKGDLRKRHEERRAGGVIRPGHLIKPSGANVVVHATAGGAAAPWFAKEDALQNRSKTDAYASTDLVSFHMAQTGDRVLARLAAAATAVANGDPLTSNGDGCLKKATGADVVIADAAEAVDNSAGGAEAFIRADIR